MMNEKLYFVFDVESIGLYGEGFAAAYVVVTASGEEIDFDYMACLPGRAEGGDTEREWVMDNVLPALPPWFKCDGPADLRHRFWEKMQAWKEKGALIFADCACPVEAKFLADRMRDANPPSSFDGPYPLHEVATVLLCVRMDPLATYERLPNELPAHNPLNDARQSARILLGALRMIDGAIKETGGYPQ